MIGKNPDVKTAVTGQPAAADSSFPKVTVTNNSGLDVDIYDVFNDSGSPKGKLTYTRLGTIKAGQAQDIQTKHLASQLQAMYTDAVSALNGNYYYQFPVAVFPVSKLDKNTYTYTITSDDKTGMEQAFQFIKYSTANVDSKIAQAFQTALTDKDPKTAVGAFFSKTQNFSKCDYPKWTAMFSWQSQFTCAWQGPYYLYNQSKDGKTIKLIAVVNITSTAKENTAVLFIAGDDGKVSDQSQHTNLSMAGDGTMNEESVGKGDLSIMLQPVWINVVQNGKDGKPKYLIGSALAGTINGITVIGTQQSKDLPDSRNPGITDKDKANSAADWAKTFSAFLSPFASLAGLIISAGMLYYMAKGHNEKRTQDLNDAENAREEDPSITDSEIATKRQEIRDDYAETVPPKMKEELSSEEPIFEQVTSESAEVVKAVKQANTESMVDRQVEELNEVLEEEPPTDDLENTASELLDAQTDMANGDFDSADAKLEDVQSKLDTTLKEKAGEMQEYEKDALEAAQEDIKAETAEREALETAEADKEKELDQDPSEDLGEGTFDEPEVDPIEMGGI